MSISKEQATKVMPEQIAYANLLFYGAWTGIFLLVTTYLLYAFGVFAPAVDIILVTKSWGLGVKEYTEVTGSAMGWDWVSMMDKGDYLNFLGLALLGGLTIVCYLILLPGYLRRKNYIFATIVILEVLVLLVAASGILGSGGH